MGTLWVDNAIVILIVIYTVGGLFRGLNRECYALMMWLVGLGVAWFFSKNFSIFLLKIIPSLSNRMAASFAALLGITLLIGGIINMLLGASAKKRGLTLVDCLGGALLGPMHGLLAVFVIVLVAGFTPLPNDRWWHESIYIPPFQTVIVKIKSLTSSELANSINYPSSLKLQVK